MASGSSIFVMTADHLKAVIDKTLENAAKGKTNKQTSLNDAARILGVQGNWGTALSRGTVIAPGADMPEQTGSAPMPAKVDVFLNIYDDDGSVNVEIHPTQEEADRAVEAYLKKTYEKDFPGIDFDLPCDQLIEALQEESDYGINVRQDRLTMALGGGNAEKQRAEDNDAARIRLENDLIARDEVDYITCDFLPQVWVRDIAMAVEPEGETLWHMTVAEALDLSGCKTVEELEDDSGHAKDMLRMSIHAPDWVKDWSGPFEVEVQGVRLAKNNRPMARAEELVWNAARDAFTMVAESDAEIQEQLDLLGLDEEAQKALFDAVTQEWWDSHAGQFVWGVEVDGTGKVTDHVIDESWGILANRLEEMISAREKAELSGEDNDDTPQF